MFIGIGGRPELGEILRNGFYKQSAPPELRN
jgi:hypothetical protein